MPHAAALCHETEITDQWALNHQQNMVLFSAPCTHRYPNEHTHHEHRLFAEYVYSLIFGGSIPTSKNLLCDPVLCGSDLNSAHEQGLDHAANCLHKIVILVFFRPISVRCDSSACHGTAHVARTCGLCTVAACPHARRTDRRRACRSRQPQHSTAFLYAKWRKIPAACWRTHSGGAFSGFPGIT